MVSCSPSGETPMQPLSRALLPVVVLGLMLAACGQPRSVAQQGPVCQSMAVYGQLPEPYPDITPNLQREHQRQTARHVARRAGVSAAAESEAKPTPVLP